MALTRVDPYATEVPMKVRDDDGNVMQASYDSNANAKLDQVVGVLNQVVTALAGIRARLEAGIKTQTIATVGTVAV